MSPLLNFRSALRQLVLHPAFSVTAVVSLALGIGGNAAVFSVMDAVLLRSMPVENPSQLFAIYQNSPRPRRYSYPLYQRFQEAAGGKPIAAMTRITRLRGVLTPGASPEKVDAQLVSANYFSLLGLKPSLGRLLNATEDEGLSVQPVAIVSHAFWRERLGGDAGVIGRTVLLNGQRVTIIGVAPETFRGVWVDRTTELWAPLALQAPLHYAQNYSNHDGFDPAKSWLPQESVEWLELIARVPPSSAQDLRPRLDAEFHRTLEREFGANPNAARIALMERRIVLTPVDRGFSNLRVRFAAPLQVLMAMVGLVLLIACVNVANLLLARGAARRREMAVRMALGASRGQLVGQLLAEGLLLGAAAAAAGLLVAQLGSRLLVAGVLNQGDDPIPFPIGVDAKVVAFTMGITILTVLIFALAPALRATRVEATGVAAATARSIYGGSRWNTANTLVCGQVALSLLLLFGAGLFARSLYNLSHAELGYNTEKVITASIDPRSGGYTEQQLPQLYRRITSRVEALPGVQSASVAMCALAVDCESRSGISIIGYHPAPNEVVQIQWSFVGQRYFETVGMRLVAGRGFDRADAASKLPRAVVNQSLVSKYFAGRNPIGGRLNDGDGDVEIIGVVRDARVNFVREPAPPMIYFSMDQHALPAESLEVRVAGNPEGMIPALRNALTEVEPGLPIDRISVLEQQVGGTLKQERMIAMLTGIFGGLALALACLGLYGVMAHAVARRTPEIGVRMALGASPKQILSGVLHQSLSIVGAGLALGLPLIWMGARSAQSLLYEVKGLDAGSLAGAFVLMSIVGALAAWIPARRAAQVDPMTALREQ